MKYKKKFLYLMLKVINYVVIIFPINKNKITLVSLKSDVIEGDLFLIKNNISNKYKVTQVLFHLKKNNFFNGIGYLFNTIKQIWHINRSNLVLINDNNYVISNFKRPGVTVMQVWHANGAIKKFGNALERQYTIMNYDYVLANSEYWEAPYSEAFGVEPSKVLITGLPQIDLLIDEENKKELIETFYEKYPTLKDKKIILYAPTFRGNIFEGVKKIYMNLKYISEHLEDGYVMVTKYHPLIEQKTGELLYNIHDLSHEDLYMLLHVSDILISDYSSVIFDYAVLNKPMLFYTPDIERYKEEVGFYVDMEELPGPLCKGEEEILLHLKNLQYNSSVQLFRDKFVPLTDGKCLKRVDNLIMEIMNS